MFPLICIFGAFSSPLVVAVVVSLSSDAFPALSYAIAVILYVWFGFNPSIVVNADVSVLFVTSFTLYSKYATFDVSSL